MSEQMENDLLKQNHTIINARNTIFKFGKEREIYIKYSFEELCFLLTCTYEACMLSLLNPQNILSGRPIGLEQDKIREIYRELLKKAFSFSKHNADFRIPFISESDINLGMNEISNTFDFNPIRRAFELYDMGRYSASADDNKLVFVRNDSNRNISADLYSHLVDNVKPLSDTEEHRRINSETFKMMIEPSRADRWDPYKSKPTSKDVVKHYYKKAYEKIIIECSEKEDFNFGSHSLEDFRKVYAVLIALGMLRFNSIYSYMLNGNRNKYVDINRPILFGKMVWLVDYVSKITGVTHDKVSLILSELTYDPEFHKDKVTVYQPLFVYNGFFFFSPSFLYYSLPQDKYLFVLKKQRKYEQTISAMAKSREISMTQELCLYIQNNSDFLCSKNYSIIKNGKSVAEFDLIIYDKKSSKVLLLELKWFFDGDGEQDHMKIDEKINNAVKNRIEKQTIFEKNKAMCLKELFDVNNSTDVDIRSCVLSRNYSGSSFVDEKIPVIDQFLFYKIINESNYDMEKIFKTLDSKSYLPTLDENTIHTVQKTVNYAGYTVEFPDWGYN